MLRLALAFLGVLVIETACSSSSDATTTCSNGTPYTDDTVFPSGTDAPNTNECVKRCGDTSTGTWGVGGVSAPTVSALPTGSCESSGETCHMSAVKRHCPKTSDLGDLYSFTCRCTGGQWSCSGVVSSSTIVSASCADGGS